MRNLNKEESGKYIEIVKSGNMDTIADFAYELGVADGEKYEKTSKCRHSFELSRIETIPTNQSMSGTNFFYKKVAYVICAKCGEIKQQDI